MKTLYTLKLILSACLITFGSHACAQNSNYLNFENTNEMQAYFKYSGDKSIIVSGHRGGREKGYPENSIEGLQNVLNQMPAIFEIDPRLTKDGIAVLMHDHTLDRTTNSTGKVSDYTWEELQKVKLIDSEGHITECKIPKLEDVIVWAKGKTIINLDKKDVPLQMVVDLIKKHKAETYVMVTVHTGAQARFFYDRIPGIMMSVFARNDKEYEDMSIAGVPWSNMIAYVGHTIDDKNKHIVDKLHKDGVRCMTSFAPTHDKLTSKVERAAKYREELTTRPDIIESDIPTEIWVIVK